MNDNAPNDTPQSAGGRARATALSGSKRSEIAKKAAEARWGVARKATHEGTLTIAGVSIPCYVLEDGYRYISTRGIMKALNRPWRGRKYTGTELPVFLEAATLHPFINNDLKEILTGTEVRSTKGVVSEALRAEALPSVCDIYLRAREAKALTTSQLVVAQQAEVLVRALSQVGIIALVDEATGYQEVRPRDALQQYLDIVLRKELAAWTKRFPDEFYENIYKLKGWPWPGMKKNRFSVVAHYTRDLVYDRLGTGVLKELELRTPKNDSGTRPHKLHQWLSDDVGHPLLAQHLHSLIMFQRLAIASGHGWQRYVKMVDQVLPKKGDTLELPLSDPDGL